MGEIVRLRNHTSRIPTTEATRFQIYRGRTAEIVGRCLLWLRIPGLVRPVEYYDEVSGIRLSVRTSLLFTKISINGRDFYFRRLSGQFDGTGQGSACS